MISLPLFTTAPVVSALLNVTLPFSTTNTNSDSTFVYPLGEAVSLRTYSPSARLDISAAPPMNEIVFLSVERIAVLSLRSFLSSEILGITLTSICVISSLPLSQRIVYSVPSSRVIT